MKRKAKGDEDGEEDEEKYLFCSFVQGKRNDVLIKLRDHLKNVPKI